jgi:hypothetical protein
MTHKTSRSRRRCARVDCRVVIVLRSDHAGATAEEEGGGGKEGAATGEGEEEDRFGASRSPVRRAGSPPVLSAV